MMKQKRQIYRPWLPIIFAVIFTLHANMPLAQAKDGSRSEKMFGITAGLFSDPFPNLWSVTLRFNLTSWMQLHAGYGGLSGTTTSVTAAGTTSVSFSTDAFGGGIRFFVPNWNFSPFVGVSYAYWSLSGSVTVLGSSMTSSTSISDIIYLTAGFDLQTGSGYTIGAGFHYMLNPSSVTNILTFVPQIYMGWFF